MTFFSDLDKIRLFKVTFKKQIIEKVVNIIYMGFIVVNLAYHIHHFIFFSLMK